jgi:hypothetical protein
MKILLSEDEQMGRRTDTVRQRSSTDNAFKKVARGRRTEPKKNALR